MGGWVIILPHEGPEAPRVLSGAGGEVLLPDVHTPAFTWPWEEDSTPNFSLPLHLSKPKDTLLSTQQTALRHLSNVQSTAKKLAWWD